jgi:hypothetical protein
VCGTVLAVLEQDCKLTTLKALSSPLSTDQLSLDLCRYICSEKSCDRIVLIWFVLMLNCKLVYQVRCSIDRKLFYVMMRSCPFAQHCCISFCNVHSAVPKMGFALVIKREKAQELDTLNIGTDGPSVCLDRLKQRLTHQN